MECQRRPWKAVEGGSSARIGAHIDVAQSSKVMACSRMMNAVPTESKVISGAARFISKYEHVSPAAHTLSSAPSAGLQLTPVSWPAFAAVSPHALGMPCS